MLRNLLVALTAALAIPVPGAINPAVTQGNIKDTICVSGYTAKIRPPVAYTNKIKFALMDSAGIPRSQSKQYELDHKISLEVGGSPDSPNNLWLEPYFGPANAHDKDRLENRLHALVCAGKLPLSTAQADLAGDWQASYAQIFGKAP